MTSRDPASLNGKILRLTPDGEIPPDNPIAGSAAFALYASNFGSYDKTYGALGGVVVFLLWLWITNLAILLGAEFNAEIERARQLHAGTEGAEESIQLEPRQAPNGAKQPAAR